MTRSEGLSLTGPDALLKQFTKSVLETAPTEKMTQHLGHEKHPVPQERDFTNIRNGPRSRRAESRARGAARPSSLWRMDPFRKRGRSSVYRLVPQAARVRLM